MNMNDSYSYETKAVIHECFIQIIMLSSNVFSLLRHTVIKKMLSQQYNKNKKICLQSLQCYVNTVCLSNYTFTKVWQCKSIRSFGRVSAYFRQITGLQNLCNLTQINQHMLKTRWFILDNIIKNTYKCSVIFLI